MTGAQAISLKPSKTKAWKVLVGHEDRVWNLRGESSSKEDPHPRLGRSMRVRCLDPETTKMRLVFVSLLEEGLKLGGLPICYHTTI